MRAYILPLVVGAALLGLLALWAINEQQQSEVAALEGLQKEARAVSTALEGSLQANIRHGRFQRERFQNVMEGIVATGGVRCIELRQPESWSLTAGEKPSATESSGEGSQLGETCFLLWRTIRLQDCMQGQGPGYGMRRGEGRWAETLDTEVQGNQILTVGIQVDRYHQALSEVHRRTLVLLVIGALAVLGTLGAWTVTLRNRELAARLERERSRSAHLEELHLAAAGLAHETKNPLNVVRGVAQQLAGDTHLPDEARNRAGEIVEEADRAAARLSDFLAFARARPPKIENAQAKALVHRVADLLRSDFDAAGVPLIVEADNLTLRIDAEQFQQVLMNLLLNAQAATPSGHTVTVRLAREGARAMLEVRDQGCGLPDDVRARLFQPYVSGRPGGHGLGLAIVKRIADAHGWRIEVQSHADRGTQFVLSELELAEERST